MKTGLVTGEFTVIVPQKYYDSSFSPLEVSTNWVQLDSSSTRHSTWLGWIPKIHNWYSLLLCGLLTNKAREFWWLGKPKTSAFSPIVASWWRSWDLCWIWQTLNAKEQYRAKNGGGIVRVQNCSNGFVKLKFYCLYTHFYEKIYYILN